MKILFTTVFLFIVSESIAQYPLDSLVVGDVVTLTLKNGKTVEGNVEALELHDLILVIGEGALRVKRENIRMVEVAESIAAEPEVVYEEYAEFNFLLPSARPAKKGTVTYKNLYGFYNQFDFGVTDALSISGGFEALSLLVEGTFPRILSVAPKYSFGEGSNYVSISANLWVLRDNDKVDWVRFASVNYTYGNDRKNITFGTSYGFREEDKTLLFFNVGGKIPLSNRVTIVSEVAFGNFDGALFDVGFRYKFANGFSFDLGFGQTLGRERRGFPLLTLTAPFR